LLGHINFKTKVRIKKHVLFIAKRFGAFYTMITSIMNVPKKLYNNSRKKILARNIKLTHKVINAKQKKTD